MKVTPTVTPQAEVKARDEDSKLRDAAQNFEALLVNEMLKSMRRAVGGADKPFGESVFTAMLDEKLAQNISETSTFGLAESLVNQMRSPGAQETHQAVDDPYRKIRR